MRSSVGRPFSPGEAFYRRAVLGVDLVEIGIVDQCHLLPPVLGGAAGPVY